MPPERKRKPQPHALILIRPDGSAARCCCGWDHYGPVSTLWYYYSAHLDVCERQTSNEGVLT